MLSFEKSNVLLTVAAKADVGAARGGISSHGGPVGHAGQRALLQAAR